MNYLLDTSIISALMKGNKRVKEKWQELIFSGRDVFINGISYYEIKRGFLAVNATNKLKVFDSLCEIIKIILLDQREVFDQAAEIYADLKRKGKLIPDADILIAATALNQKLTLVSNDTDFKKVERISLENWIVDDY